MRRSVPDAPTVPAATRRRKAGRLLPVALLAAGLAAFLALGGHRWLTLEALERNREALLAWVEIHPVLAPLAFTGAYTAAVACSLPVALLLSVAGGFLFGPVLGTLCAAAGATAGATALFAAARTACAGRLRGRVEAALIRMDAGFRANAFHYLLFLRLVPLFPFWLVNIAAAFAGVPLRAFVPATAIGVVPATLVYALVGNGLGAAIEAGGAPDLGILFEPEILAPMIGLAVLALAPVLVRRWRGRISAGRE